ncbi:hypothetical protein HK405_004055, partial [Cladochytrium tenue]
TAVTYHYAWAPDADYGSLTLNTSMSRVSIKQPWWRQFLNSTFLSEYSQIKAVCTFEFLKAEELTMRDFTSLGAPPNGFDEDNTVAAAFVADVTEGDYGSRIRWASATSTGSKSVVQTNSASTSRTSGSSHLVHSTLSVLLPAFILLLLLRA